MSKKSKKEQSPAQSPTLGSLHEIDELIKSGEYLDAFDRISHALGQAELSSDNLVKQVEARFKTTVLRLCGFEGTAGELGGLQSLVGKAPDLHSRLMAASWVRACTASASFPHSSDLDRALSATVEQELLEVYPRYGLDARAQTYEKRKKLTSALAELERFLGTTATSAIELNVLGTIRQSFMKAFKTPLAQAVVWPFFPKELVAEARLAALFQSVTDLVESGADDVMDSIQERMRNVRSVLYRGRQIWNHL